MLLPGLSGPPPTFQATYPLTAIHQPHQHCCPYSPPPQSDIVDKHGAEGVMAAELSALRQITEKYKIAREDVDKLIKWKHTHY